MPHTPLLSSIARLMSQMPAAPRVSRRSFAKASVAAASAAGLRASNNPRVAIVGAGLAGLTCAYRLSQQGVSANLYDANTRFGGRCWTLRGAFDDGQIVERGGELIDQDHTEIRQLCQELRLDLDNLSAAEPNGSLPFYNFNGAPYYFSDAVADLKTIWKKLHSDLGAAGFPTTYYQSTQRGRELDQMSIIDWLNESVPGGGASSRLGKLLDVAYNIEYGEECSQQSALNLIYLLGYCGPGQLRIFGTSNEKYHVRGGNDQIATRLAGLLAPQIHAGYFLTAIRRSNNGTYQLDFQVNAQTQTVTADRVVLALPFSILRQIDYSQAGFRPMKSTAIQQIGMGSNSKLHLQFRSRLWNQLGSSGETYADTGYQNTWEVTRAQAGQSGILVNFSGGNNGRAASGKSPATVLSQMEPALPGITAQWNQKSQLQYWPGYPLTLGSYSYWKVGQYTAFSGVEGEIEGACHFCGEHTSIESQGYLNGAVETGQRAAAEVVNALK